MVVVTKGADLWLVFQKKWICPLNDKSMVSFLADFQVYFKYFYIQNYGMVQVKAVGSGYTLIILLEIMWTSFCDLFTLHFTYVC